MATKKIQRTSRTIGYADCLDPASSYKAFVEWFRYWNLNAKETRIKAQETGQRSTHTEFEGYIQSVSDEQVVLRNYAGDLFVYPQVRQKKGKKSRLVPCYSAPAHL